MKLNYDKDFYYKANFFDHIPDTADIIKPLKEIGILAFIYFELIGQESVRSLVTNDHMPIYYIENNGFNIDPILILRSKIPAGFHYDVPFAQNQSEELLTLWKHVFRDAGYPHVFLFVPDNQNENMKKAYAFATDKHTFLQQDLAEASVAYFHDKAKTLIQNTEIIPLPSTPKKLSKHHENLITQVYTSKKKSQNQDFLKEIDFIKYKCVKFGQIKQLSPREIQCLQLTLHGKRAKEIARLLGLQQKTVEFYLEHLKTKIGCRNKMELLIKLFTFDI